MTKHEPNWRLQQEPCAVCAGSVDEDGYGECEECRAMFCAEHNSLISGLCRDCRDEAMREAAA